MKIWNEKFQNKIESITEQFKDKWVDEETREEYYKILNDFNLKSKRFSKLRRKQLFWQFFVLPFTLFLTYKKYNNIKNQRLDIENDTEKTSSILRQEKFKIISSNVFEEYLKSCFEILNLKEMGPINSKIISLMDNHQDFSYNENQNSSCSCWYTYDENKIIVSHCTEKYKTVIETYWGSITVKNGDNYITIRASYSHPKPVIDWEEIYYLFAPNLKGLEFSYRGLDPKIKLSRSHKRETPFENHEFEKTFDWTRNDETKIRMLFTPLAQETYVNEVRSYNKTSKIKFVNAWDQFNSRNCFLFNNDYQDLYKTMNSKFVSLFKSFVYNDEFDLLDFLSSYKQLCYEFIFSIYNKIKYLFIFESFISSIDNTNEIKGILNDNSINESLPFYVLNKIIKYDFIRGDLPKFNVLKKLDINNDIYVAKFNQFTFDKKWKTTIVYKSGFSIPVDYCDYIKKDIDFNIYFSIIDSEKSKQDSFNLNLFDANLFGENSSLNPEIKRIIREYKDDHGLEISIKNSIVCVYSKGEADFNKIKSVIEKIKSFYI